MREGLREPDGERFRGGVERVAGRRGHQPGERRDVDDAAVPAFDHRGQQAMGELGQRRHHHLQRRLVALPRGAERARQAITGVVDERVDRQAPGAASAQTRMARCGARDRHDHVRRHTMGGTRPRGDSLQAISRRAVRTRSKPLAANTSANASPMPEEAPVTSAVRRNDL